GAHPQHLQHFFSAAAAQRRSLSAEQIRPARALAGAASRIRPCWLRGDRAVPRLRADADDREQRRPWLVRETAADRDPSLAYRRGGGGARDQGAARQPRLGGDDGNRARAVVGRSDSAGLARLAGARRLASQGCDLGRSGRGGTAIASFRSTCVPGVTALDKLQLTVAPGGRLCICAGAPDLGRFLPSTWPRA